MQTILIVDDEPVSLSALEALVRAEGLETVTARDLQSARQALATVAPIAVLADYHLPDGTGLELAPECVAAGAELVMVTGRATVDVAVETLRAGATDFLQKPVEAARLKTLLERICRTGAERQEIAALRSTLRELGRFGSMIGSSTPMQQVYDRIARVAPTDASVMISGESGTGKELVAETIHRLSRRAHRPFIAINCGAISATLIESELFGHERGSFTGADRQRKGVFERAHLGTLFLDEISEMPLDLQVKLLRVLETGTFMRVGAERQITVDVRVIAASNCNLDESVAQGKFRADLLYRLRVVPVDLPPLRERGDDILALTDYFLDDFASASGDKKNLSPSALAGVRAYAWPGNVRELRNAMQQAYILAEEQIHLEHLPVQLKGKGLVAPAKTNGGPESPAAGAKNTVVVSIPSSLADIERRVVLATLEQCAGDKPAAANTLGISLKTLYTRLREYSAAGIGEG
ncbi:MAG: sigma-54 dependent transcriptional regulator [Acidobacteriota bacterium]